MWYRLAWTRRAGDERISRIFCHAGIVEELQDRAHHGDGEDPGEQRVPFLRLRCGWSNCPRYHPFLGEMTTKGITK